MLKLVSSLLAVYTFAFNIKKIRIVHCAHGPQITWDDFEFKYKILYELDGILL